MKLSFDSILHGLNSHLYGDNNTTHSHKTPIRLCSNENPNGPSPLAIKALKNFMPSCCRYPNDAAPELMAKLASHCNVKEKQLLLGAGSTDVIEMMIRALSFGNKRVVIPKYCYTIYRNFAFSHKVDICAVEMDDFASYPQKMVEAANSKDIGLVIIDNPNNPTGQYLSHQQIEEIIKHIPKDIPIVIDEAYFEFSVQHKDYQTAIPLLKKYANLLVTRTFSKIYGLASLRIGYAIGHENLIEHIHRYKRIFAVASPAILAATAAMDDEDYLQKSLDTNNEGLAYLGKELKQLGIKFIPSSANFICFYTGEKSDEICSDITSSGVLIKNLHAYHIEEHLRVSIGLPKENKAFIEALKKSASRYGLI